MTAYPERNQTPEQQAMDKAECQQFAKNQTGFDPQQALGQTPPPPTAVRPRKRMRQEEQEQAQMSQQNKQKLQAYNKAEGICLKGKGYSVG